MKTLRHEVLAFALLMEQRLRDKDAEKGSIWKEISEHNLMVHATSKAIRLEAEVADDDLLEPERIKHAVDLANYCMMIADVAGALQLPSEQAQQWTRDDKQTYYVLLLVGGHGVTQEAITSWCDAEVPAVPACVISFMER